MLIFLPNFSFLGLRKEEKEEEKKEKHLNVLFNSQLILIPNIELHRNTFYYNCQVFWRTYDKGVPIRSHHRICRYNCIATWHYVNDVFAIESLSINIYQLALTLLWNTSKAHCWWLYIARNSEGGRDLKTMGLFLNVQHLRGTRMVSV